MATEEISPFIGRVLVSFISIAILALLAAPALASIGAIGDTSGTVYYRAVSAEKWTVASKGQPLKKGDRVRTAEVGRAELVFKDKTTLTLGNSTELEITEFLLKWRKRSSVYSISTGKVRAVVGGFSGRTDIKVKTPTGVAGVKGTDFIVMNHGDANVLFGKEDSVEVTGDNGASVRLDGGKMTENTRGSSPIEPVTVEPGSALEEVRAGLEAVTDVHAPVEWETAGRLPDILARWNINYGHYLADSRRFAEALDVLLIARDLASLPGTKAEAHLERGTVLSRNLQEPDMALAEYMRVIDAFPVEPFLENAVFSAGVIHMEMGRNERAAKFFRRYLSDYPEGSRRETVEQFLRVMERD